MTLETWTLGLHLLTAHAMPGYEAVTPGIYARHESGATFGAYRNSIGRRSAYAGWTFESGRFALTVGAVSGYERRCRTDRWTEPNGSISTNPVCSGHVGDKLGPLLAPSVRIGHARLSLVAFKKPAVHLSVEI